MSEPLHPGVFADIKAFVEKFKIPENATDNERLIYVTVKGDMALLVAEIERLQGEVIAEREACARITEAYDDGGYDPEGKHEIAADIRARGEKK